MKVAIYCRVSTDDQRDNGTSLEMQASKSRDYAESRGWTVVDSFQEPYSGGYIERPLLNKVRALVRAHSVDAVLVYAIDRLSRDQVHPFILFGEMRDNKVMLCSVTEGEISSPEDIFIKLGLFSYKASGERDKIRQRTMDGRRARVEQGIPPGGSIPYGYQWRVEPLSSPHDKRNEITRRVGLDLDPATSPHVALMYRMAGEGTSLRKIVEELNNRGIPTSRGNATWKHTQVRSILTNPTYAGRREAYRWMRVPTGQDNDKQKSALRDVSERITLPSGVVTPLVDETTFAAIQQRLQLNAIHSKRNRQYPPEAAMLRGFVVCAICGHKMNVRRGGRDNLYYQYRCYHHDRCPAECSGSLISCPELDNAVWEQFYDLLSKPQIIAGALATIQRDDPTAGDLCAIDTAEKDALFELGTLVENLSKVRGLLASMAQKQADVLEERLMYLQGERERLLARQVAWRTAQNRVDDLTQWCKRVEGKLKNADYTIRKEAFIAFGLTIRVHPRTHVPRWEGTTNLKFDFMDKSG